ncbi:conserved hypothetical protein [Thiomonas arsenitoxydans]|uniref:UDP-N-acetylglucosamine kinase n=1 Tax=Thiomonas arsenitoxydans (strain DSM 22701 / CIP 110005 / 3As) TaxID=426114 RepID=D6CLK5_THIA3|nr:AAA family ATPase [Thiomonas arsenitoxydans]CQR43752.1 conserved hypothetical protein [Thiomonas sp. CB3]CAZ89433.1 conserved hypothetical protein; putative ATPase domain [Thiomonas arsenitoxydans]CQR33508.1 conserved hypothetical protein [Thiomonas arsenitoxydans]CQR35827.1 conserved hypothetical protein [Thiomonas arsenitoxydans]CQR38087.1 conserved hypothetical protein [Thiomonas arsenitoxydans]
MNPEHRILLIAGPNGAGKTTFAKIFLPEADYSDFINADLIASGLSPFDPDRAARRAARLMLEEIDLRVKNGKSFALETTLSGRGYAAQIPRWRALGYHAKLVFLSLPDAEMAVQRVAARVTQGGHAIPEAVIRRRFSAGLLNFHHLYKPLVNAWALYDNSGDLPSLISSGDNP